MRGAGNTTRPTPIPEVLLERPAHACSTALEAESLGSPEYLAPGDSPDGRQVGRDLGNGSASSLVLYSHPAH